MKPKYIDHIVLIYKFVSFIRAVTNSEDGKEEFEKK